MARAEIAEYLGVFSTNVYCRLLINHEAWSPLPLRPVRRDTLLHRHELSP